MSKFTFKKHPSARGLASVAEAGKEWVDIKLNGIPVGYLYKCSFSAPIDIRFQVWKKDIMEDGNPNCKWKWITLTYRPPSIQEAKDFLTKFSKEIQEKFKLFIRE